MMPPSSLCNGGAFRSNSHRNNHVSNNDVVMTEHSNDRCCDNINYNDTMDDDGMYVHREPMFLLTDTTTSEGSIVPRAIEHYHNIAQNLIGRCNFVDAHEFYVRALELVDDESLAENSTTMAYAKFVLLHNHGYCLYKLRNDDKTKERALQTYQTALQFATKFHLGDFAMATTYYCIGYVTSMRSLTESSSGSTEADDASSTMALRMFHEALRRCDTIIVPNNGSNDDHTAVMVGWIWNHMGRILSGSRDQRNYPQALIAYQKALSIRRKFCPSDSKLIAASICNLAQAYHLCGMLDCAKRHYNEFLHIAQSSQKYLVDVPPILSCLAEIHVHEKECCKAKSLYRQAICIARAVFTRSPLQVATLQTKLGQLHFQLQEFQEALRCYIHGLNIQSSALPWNDAKIVGTLMSVAQIHRKLGNRHDAMRSLCQVHSIQVAMYGAKSSEVAATISSMGLIQFEQRQFAIAYELCMQALQIQEECHGSSSNPNTDIAATLSTIGLVLYNQGDRTLAKKYFTDSLRIRCCLFGPDHCENAILWYNLATISLEQGDDEAALDYFKESLRIERCVVRDGNNNHDAIVLCLQHIAIVHQRRGQLDDALESFQEALVCEQSRNESDNIDINEVIGQLFNLMGDVYLHLGRTCSMMECYVQAARISQTTANHHLVMDRMNMVGYNLYDLAKLHPPCASAA